MADDFLIVDPTDGSSWDQRVAAHEKATFFHSAAWASVLRDSYGHCPSYLVGSGGMALPVMEVKSYFTGHRGVSLPFTDECLPLAPQPVQERQLVLKAIEIGRARKWRYFGSQGSGLLFPEIAAGPPSYYSHTVDLQKGARDLFVTFSESNRRAIRKAQRAGVQVDMANDLSTLGKYYELHCRTRRRFGLPPQPWTLFQQIHHHVLTKGLGFVLLARHQGKVIAGAVFCHFGRHAVFKFGASDPANQAVRPNNLILWEGIQRLADKGFAVLSLGRTSMSNEGLRRFKLSWNSTEHRTWYLKYDYQAGGFVPNADKAYGWHNGIFRRLPIWMSRLAGACLYRHWA